MNLFLQLLAIGVVNGAAYAVLATGFGLVYRTFGVFHVAYGALTVLAAFCFYALVTLIGLAWWPAAVATLIFGMLLGCLIELVFYRPFFYKRSSPGTTLVASLGLALVLQNALALIFGNEIHTIARPPSQVILFGSVSLTAIQLWQFGICSLVLCLLALATRSPLFKRFRALEDNPELLEIHGWSVRKHRLIVFALSGALSAIPACWIMIDTGTDPHAGLSYVLIAVTAVLIGGVAHMKGWILGGMVIAVLQSAVAWNYSSTWMDFVTFGLLIVVLLFRPEGILSIPKRAEET